MSKILDEYDAASKRKQDAAQKLDVARRAFIYAEQVYREADREANSLWREYHAQREKALPHTTRQRVGDRG